MVKNKATKNKKTKKKLHLFPFLTTLLTVLVGIELVVGGVGVYALGSMLKSKPDLKLEDLFSQESTLIFDKNGRQIRDVGMTIRENVTYNQIPEAMIDAFLAVEDSRYFTHNGFDVARFAKAALVNLKEGSFSQGGSTFTMQMVKLAYFANDDTGVSKARNIEYKVQQIVLAMELENQADKKTIFEMYLNKMNFGGTGNIRGVQKASQQYFGKDVSELSLPECALLAGVINSPYYYDPHNYLEHATKRRNEVLYMMNYHGYITDEEYELAKSIKVEDLLVDSSAKSDQDASYQYQAYVDEVIKEAEEVTGLDPLTVSMEIYTCMDPEVQDTMEAIAAGENPYVVWPDEKMEVGVISENNQTGEIVGICGGRNYSRGGSMLLNHATDQYKQPGSSIKPVLDYDLAFEHLQWATSHVLCDRPVGSAGWVFKNANGKYQGDVTLETAIAQSLNTPAIQTLDAVIDEIGQDEVLKFMHSIGFNHIDDSSFDLQYAIGGSRFVCSAKELMGAHAVLMNGGYYIKPHTITRIVFRNGLQEPYEANFTPDHVLSEEAAYLTGYMLNKCVYSSSFNYMQLLKRSYPTFAKTGTTDWGDAGFEYGIPKGAAKDRWMVAETTQFTTAVWIGYEKAEDGDEYFTDYKNSLNIPGNINNQLLDVLNRENVPGDLVQPEGIYKITHIKGLYPYTSPIDGMPKEYVTTGYVKGKVKLQAPQSMTGSLKDIKSFSAVLGKDGKTISIEWSKYPDEEKTGDGKHTQDISLRDANGKVIQSATGNKMFDYSWVLGTVEYKARISQNGKTVKEVSSGSNKKDVSTEDLAPNTETQVCGFYGIKDSKKSSKEICSTFITPIDETTEITAPAIGSRLSEVKAWASSYGIALAIDNGIADNDEVLLLDGNGTNILGMKFMFSKNLRLRVVKKNNATPEPTVDPQPTETPDTTPTPTPTVTPTPSGTPDTTPDTTPTPAETTTPEPGGNNTGGDWGQDPIYSPEPGTDENSFIPRWMITWMDQSIL
ncbi:MAG: transglycosylase domain-containing protein [Solobacterium sp.]|nr:transglycosylase domain-containing protein [Solobacterium sp.]